MPKPLDGLGPEDEAEADRAPDLGGGGSSGGGGCRGGLGKAGPDEAALTGFSRLGRAIATDLSDESTVRGTLTPDPGSRAKDEAAERERFGLGGFISGGGFLTRGIFRVPGRIDSCLKINLIKSSFRAA